MGWSLGRLLGGFLIRVRGSPGRWRKYYTGWERFFVLWGGRRTIDRLCLRLLWKLVYEYDRFRLPTDSR